MPTNKALIVLQENSGRVPLPAGISPDIRDAIFAVVDRLIETIEDVKVRVQAEGRYDVVHLLTDDACTRSNLLDRLITETRKGRVIDLVVLGHGLPEQLVLKRRPHLTGGPVASSGSSPGTIRSLAAEAGDRGLDGFNLRLVYMCNCFGSTVNDDWLAAGAKVSVGSRGNDWMPEPMTTFFLHNWTTGQSAKKAAENAYQATVPFYTALYPPTVQPTYKTVTVRYPCPTWAEPTRTCEHQVQVPTGAQFRPNPKIVESELVVAGNPNLKY